MTSNKIHEHFKRGGGPLTTTDICKMFDLDLPRAHQVFRQVKKAKKWSADIRKDGKDYRGLPRQVLHNLELRSNQ